MITVETRQVARNFVLLILCVGAFGCVSVPSFPDFVSPDLDVTEITALVVLPAVDLRKDRSIRIRNLSDRMLPQPIIIRWLGIASSLKKRGYSNIEFATDWGEVSHVTDDDFSFPAEEWVRSLRPTEDRWIWLVALDDVTFRRDIGSAAAAVCRGVLFDLKTATVVWRHRAVSEYGLPGLGGSMARKNDMITQVLSNCSEMLASQLPKR